MMALSVIVPADGFDRDALVAHVQHIEQLGYESVWIPDMFGREIYVTAGHLLARTTALTVVSGIAHVYGRDPIASSQAGRTLAELSGGRFVQGLGVSHPIAAEMRGMTWEPPVGKMRAHLEVMRGRTPLRVRAEQPPVFIAAHGPKMIELAAELADGASTYMQPASFTVWAREQLGPDKTLSVVLPACLSTDPELARAAGRRALSIYLPLPAYQRRWAASGFDERDWSANGSDRLVDAFVAWGDAAAIRERVDEHLRAGATSVVLSGCAPDGGTTTELFDVLAPRGA